MAAKKAPAKKKGRGRAYAPVPKGYKANWNVPEGTPWKKNSPYNPANRVVSPVRNSPEKIAAAKKAAAKKAAAAKVKAKTTAKPTAKTTVKPPSKNKKVSSKKPVVGKDGLTDYQRTISYPEKISIGNRKLQPYDAKWKAEVARKSKRTRFDKIAEAALEFSPLGGIVYAAEAASGKSFRGPLNKPAKKTGRLAAGANAAFYLTPFKGANKIKKGVQTVRGARNAQQMLTKGGAKAGAAKETGTKAYVNNLIAAEIARYQREMAKKNKGK